MKKSIRRQQLAYLFFKALAIDGLFELYIKYAEDYLVTAIIGGRDRVWPRKTPGPNH